MKTFLTRWFVTTIAVAVAAQITGMHAEGLLPLLVAALLLGFFNAVIRPVLLVLSLPFILVTLGFFILVVNALMLWIVGKLVPGFHVDGFWTAFFGSIVVSIVSWFLNAIIGTSETQQHIAVRRTESVDGIKRVEGRVVDSEPRA